jgi:hypothetical protein
MTIPVQIPPSNVPLMAVDGSLHPAYRTFFTALLDRAGGILGGLQPADPTLDGLAAMGPTLGVVVSTAPDAFTKIVGKHAFSGPITNLTIVDGVVTAAS